MSDKMVEEMALEPCPFCGTAMRDHGHCFSHPRPSGPDCIIRHYSFDRQKAEAWNTRAQAAATIAERRMEEMREALSECEDKLWVLHFSLTDEAECQAAIDACNMATAALRPSGGV
jgi:hypothetical protein